MKEDIRYWIWLSRIEGLNPKVLNDLIEKYKHPKVLWDRAKEELIQEGMKEAYANKITDSKYRVGLERYLEYMKNNKIDIINIYDENYPDKLRKIYDPPIVIYIKGNKEILNEKAMAIVGCRLCTKYGETQAKKLAYNLSLNNINVISGLARE